MPGIGVPMIFLIWTIWFFNQFMCLIILLNFLIAIISQSYEQVMTLKIQVKYMHKSELNRECFLFLKTMRLLSDYIPDQGKFNIFYLWSTIGNGEEDENDWLGFVQTLKNVVTQESRKVNSKIDSLKEKVLTIDE